MATSKGFGLKWKEFFFVAASLLVLSSWEVSNTKIIQYSFNINLSLISIFYWCYHKDKYLPRLFILLIGLIVDSVNSNVMGFTAVSYLLIIFLLDTYIKKISIPKTIATESIVFCFVLLGNALIKGLFSLFMNSDKFFSFKSFAVEFCMSLLAFIVIRFILDFLYILFIRSK